MVQKREKQNRSVGHHCRAGEREPHSGGSGVEVRSERDGLRLWAAPKTVSVLTLQVSVKRRHLDSSERWGGGVGAAACQR